MLNVVDSYITNSPLFILLYTIAYKKFPIQRIFINSSREQSRGHCERLCAIGMVQSKYCVRGEGSNTMHSFLMNQVKLKCASRIGQFYDKPPPPCHKNNQIYEIVLKCQADLLYTKLYWHRCKCHSLICKWFPLEKLSELLNPPTGGHFDGFSTHFDMFYKNDFYIKMLVWHKLFLCDNEC